MGRLFEIIILTLAGYVLISTLNEPHWTHSKLYHFVVYGLLAVGLYGSVYGIDTNKIKENRSIILTAITIGVLLKTIIIGLILFAFTGEKISFLLAIIVAQIDPLSVVALEKDKQKLSDRGQLILNAWASFDDPITTLISVYLSSIILKGEILIGQASFNYVTDFGINILFAASILLAHKIGKKNTYFDVILLGISFVICVWFSMMLGIAIIGLFLRPNLKGYLEKGVNFAFYSSLILLGTLLIDGVSILHGLFLAIGAILSQLVVGVLLTSKLEYKDRFYLAFAQQNGITAIILSLLFESEENGIVAVVAPAILFINLGYLVSNKLLDYKFRNSVSKKNIENP